MPADPTSADPSVSTPAEPGPYPDREISLEEWIAAGQACCGAADE